MNGPLAALSISALIALGCTSRAPLPGPTTPLVPTAEGALPASPPTIEVEEDAPLPTPRSTRLESGLTVRHLQRDEWPLVSIYLVSARGGEVYPRSQAGLSKLGSWAVVRHVNNSIDGFSLGATTSRETSVISTTVRPELVPEALRVIGAAVSEASPPDDVVEDVRLAQLNGMRDNRRSSVSAATSTSLENLFGSRHHLATPIWGDLDVVADTSPDDVRAAFRRRWSPSSCALVVVGDIDEGMLDPLVAETFAGFVDRPGESPTIPRFGERPEREVIAFHDGDEAAYVVLSDLAPRVDDDDSLAFSALMTLTAGHFSSRVNRSLRLEHTLTYGAHASYLATRFAGKFSLSMTVPADEVDSALDILEAQVQGILDTPPTDAEVDRVKLLLESRLRASLDHNSSAAHRLALGWVRGEPLDLFTDRVARVRALTSDDLLRVAREYLHPGAMPIVVVGDLNEVNPWNDLDHLGRVRIFTFQFED